MTRIENNISSSFTANKQLSQFTIEQHRCAVGQAILQGSAATYFSWSGKVHNAASSKRSIEIGSILSFVRKRLFLTFFVAYIIAQIIAQSYAMQGARSFPWC